MEMTMTMPMNGFMEMTDNEMFAVDGGNWNDVRFLILCGTFGCCIGGPAGFVVAIGIASAFDAAYRA